MNFVYLSPHFPPNYYHFCVRLRELGVNVLGIADAPYDELRWDLKGSLSEYYRVDNMEDYDQILRAVGYFTHKHGKIDRVDSHNEHWLETEAQLRTDFNIFGTNSKSIKDIKYKSLMKKKFIEAGLPVARGEVIEDIKSAKKFIDTVKYPIVAKPDKGVGAAYTYKIHNEKELEEFFAAKTPESYIMEEFIDGQIFTFDGLTDRNGEAVFYTSHTYGAGIMETVNDDMNVYYYSLRDIPHDLKDAGFKVLKAFNVIEKFFHFEFFRTYKDNKIVPLEVNMRPPGGYTTDMFNFANDIDVYQQWANIIAHGKFNAYYERKYHCCYISRKDNKNYKNSHDEILARYWDKIVMNTAMPGIFAHVMGDYAYIVRSSSMDEIKEMIDFIQLEV